MLRRIVWAVCLVAAVIIEAPTASACETGDGDVWFGLDVPPAFWAAACSGGNVNRVAVIRAQVVMLEVSDALVARNRKQHFEDLARLFASEIDREFAVLSITIEVEGPPMRRRPSLWEDDRPPERTTRTQRVATFSRIQDGSVVVQYEMESR